MWRHTDRWDCCGVVEAVEAYLLNANKSQALTRYPAAEEKFNANLKDRISKQWLSKALAVPAWLLHRFSFFSSISHLLLFFYLYFFFIFHGETYCNFQNSKLCLQWKKSNYWNEGAKPTWQTHDRQTDTWRHDSWDLTCTFTWEQLLFNIHKLPAITSLF